MMLQEGSVKIWQPQQVGSCACHVEGNTLKKCCQIYVRAGKHNYVPINEQVSVDDSHMTPSAVMHSG